MPIKFRCRYCEQFLGISRSRAGAIVDCPQCGRSIRVPELDGRTRKMPAHPQPGRDESLISALSELSELSELPELTGSSAAPNHSHPHPSENVPPSTAVDNPRITPPMSLPQTIPEVVTVERETVVPPQPVVVEEDDWSLPDETETSEGPIALEESLSEMAEFEPVSGSAPVSAELLHDMRTARRTESWLSIAGLFLLVTTLASGVASGWWLTRSGYLPGLAAVPHPDDPPAEVTAKRPARDDLTLTTSSQPVKAAGEHTDTSVITMGRVEYVSEDGSLQPDAGALVLLLPRARQGTSLLDGGNLRLSTEAPDFRATVAAMNVLGATATQADANGEYQLVYEPGSDDQVVVVSQHRSAADDSVPREIQNLLLNWFESPTHVTGRLAVAASPPPEDGPLDFRIGVTP